jgi:hypothetical protein
MLLTLFIYNQKIQMIYINCSLIIAIYDIKLLEADR